MEKEYQGNTVEYWCKNATEDYINTPISVLKYIRVLEEALEDAVLYPDFDSKQIEQIEAEEEQ